MCYTMSQAHEFGPFAPDSHITEYLKAAAAQKGGGAVTLYRSSVASNALAQEVAFVS